MSGATLEILDEGLGQYLKPDPDGYREWVRDHKSRALVSKLMTEQEAISRCVQDGEYSNVVMTTRLQAGAMGLPFLPIRSFGGTDGFRHSGAKLIQDPYTGQPITIVPALNPDVALIHVQQADQYGNARVFGTGIAHLETALASKKVVISAEEIVDTEEIRRDPGRTTIPYYAVDAVVPYLEKWVYSVADHQEMLDKLVGASKLLELQRRATIKEGYTA